MRKWLSPGLLLLVAVSARGDQVVIDIPGLPQYTYDGYYVGPVKATVNGSGPLDLWCDDFLHTTYVPANYYANLSTLPTPAPARFTGIWQYEQIVWLISQYYQMSTRANDTVGNLQFAIWLVFDPNESALKTQGALTWLAAIPGQSTLATYDYGSVRIFTPTTGSGAHYKPSYQEFITTVPEPSTVLTLGLGFLISVLAIRKKRVAAPGRTI
jgi:PEP-CTERM motif